MFLLGAVSSVLRQILDTKTLEVLNTRCLGAWCSAPSTPRHQIIAWLRSRKAINVDCALRSKNYKKLAALDQQQRYMQKDKSLILAQNER